MKKIKLITTLSSLGVLGATFPLVVTSCSKDDKKEDEEIVETDNYVQTNNDKFYIANDFDPNIFCGDTETINFVSPTKPEKGIQRTINKTDIKSITIKSLKSTVTNLKDKFLNGFTAISSIDFSALSSILYFGTQFIYNCDNLTEINIGNISKNRLPHDTNSFATENKDAICYTNGIKLIYPDDTTWDLWVWTNLIDHNSTTTPYRKVNANFNGMEFKSQKYILTDNYDPNIFITCDPAWGTSTMNWRKTQYPTKGGTPITIDYDDDRSSLTQVILARPNTTVTSIGNCLLEECTNLTRVEIGTLPQLTTLGRNFLAECSNLTQFNLNCLASVTEVDGEFLYGCSKLISIDLTLMTDITKIGASFLQDCTSLKRIDLFDKSPKNIDTSTEDFMKNVPADCLLYSKAEYKDDYMLTEPWKGRQNYIKER